MSSWRVALGVLLIVISLGGLVGVIRVMYILQRGGEAVKMPREVTTAHPVDDSMRQAAGRGTSVPVPDFAALGTDGRTHADESLAGRAAVLLFIQRGCPCSEEAQPLFNRLHAVYRDAGQFLGVVDGTLDEASAWRDQFAAGFPLLADPDNVLVNKFGVTNSAFVALVTADGRVAKLWPGFSKPMLRDLGSRLAAAAGREPAGIAWPDAPSSMYSGCPYED